MKSYLWGLQSFGHHKLAFFGLLYFLKLCPFQFRRKYSLPVVLNPKIVKFESNILSGVYGYWLPWGELTLAFHNTDSVSTGNVSPNVQWRKKVFQEKFGIFHSILINLRVTWVDTVTQTCFFPYKNPFRDLHSNLFSFSLLSKIHHILPMVEFYTYTVNIRPVL